MTSDSGRSSLGFLSATVCIAGLFLATPWAGAQESRAQSQASRPSGNLDVRWIHGSADPAASTDPPIQVHRYDPTTWILRQNKSVNFEAPFLYLLFGTKRALLFDTGATASDKRFPIRDVVQGLVKDWLREHRMASIELVVAHSHAHGDHVAGDGQFQRQPSTVVVHHAPAAVSEFFGIKKWPEEIVPYDLGGRVLRVIPIPGHEPSSIALYDEASRLLLTGDSLYPGRLYVADWPAFRKSVARLATFAASHQISYVLGAHVEMTSKPGTDYPVGTKFQPDEHVLQLEARHVEELSRAVEKLGDKPARDVHDDFIIWPK
jgi:glyoxylase-like metal-dependent hydrolase (beta-lactamase superfamily II)